MFDIINNFSLFALIILIITIIVVYKNQIKRKRLKVLLSSNEFRIGSVIIIIFLFIIKFYKNETDEMKKINRSSNIALIALIVALLAYLELTIIPFWLIFLTSYYLHIE